MDDGVDGTEKRNGLTLRTSSRRTDHTNLLTLDKIALASNRRGGFQKGQSGNPNGRRTETERYGSVNIAELARSYGPQAIHTLVMCLRDPRYKLAAAVALLDRGFGKPTVAIHTQSEATVLHLVAAQEHGDELLRQAMSGSGVTIDADETNTATHDDAPPLE